MTCIVKGKKQNITQQLGLRKLALELHKSFKCIKTVTPLASGALLLEFSSAEYLQKALSMHNTLVGGLEVVTALPSEIQTYNVVIHGVPLEENLENFKSNLRFDTSRGACLIGIARLQNKFKKESRAVSLNFSGTCPE